MAHWRCLPSAQKPTPRVCRAEEITVTAPLEWTGVTLLVCSLCFYVYKILNHAVYTTLISQKQIFDRSLLKQDADFYQAWPSAPRSPSTLLRSPLQTPG